jgi:hypothetical protein
MTLHQPPYVKHNDVSQSAVGSLMSSCIGSLGLWHIRRVMWACVHIQTYIHAYIIHKALTY